ncbi:MAG: transketolase [Zetaproteobacteria bacterium]|nr:MAG: transketolase [Zetaproteobacteria bacterium]
MRNAFADELTRLAGEDPSIVLLSGDIGNRMFDRFKQHCPGRFFNCGIAEGNMMGMAAGMALSALRPVVYTIAPFTTYRCYEQIRVDLCYHHLPVVIVGAGAGLTYARLGPTHHSCEDLAVMRVLPGMTVFAPADAPELRQGLRALLARRGPAYIRIGKKGEPVVTDDAPEFRLGRARPLRRGRDLSLIGTGTLLSVLIEAAGLLERRGISAAVEGFHTVKPLDGERLESIFSRYDAVVVAEEHSRLGGLGGAVAEWLAGRGPMRGRLRLLGTDDAFLHTTGGHRYARSCFGLSAEGIADQAEEHLRHIRGAESMRRG